MIFHWCLNDNKSPQVSRTLLSILTDLNNGVVWMVSIRPPISNFSNPLSKPLGIIITIFFSSKYWVLKYTNKKKAI